MEIKTNEVSLVLEGDEIMNMWNVVMFALDLQCEREKKKESCMTQDELKLARYIVEVLGHIK